MFKEDYRIFEEKKNIKLSSDFQIYHVQSKFKLNGIKKSKDDGRVTKIIIHCRKFD